MRKTVLALALLPACIKPSSGATGGTGVGIAVVDSDFHSTAITLMDPSKDTITSDGCINSGSVNPVLSTALSGDVALPSQPQPDHNLLVIDRTNAALITVDPTTCSVLSDFSVSTGFSPDPHDVVGLSPTKAYVTRFSANTMPSGTPGANDEGNDVLIVDPSKRTIMGRIDLSSYAVPVSGATILAGPDRAVAGDGRVYVSLSNLSADFMTTSTGRIVIIDPSKDSVTGTIDLPSWKSCSQLDYEESSKTLLVACGGDVNAPLETQVTESALIVFDVSGSTPRQLYAVPASATGGRPIVNSLIGVISDDSALAGTYGDGSGSPPDALWMVRLKEGTATRIEDADGTYVLASAVIDSTNHRAYVTDSGMKTPRISIYDVSTPGVATLLTTLTADAKSGLPPILAAWY
jgi:hypothetical protein